MAVGRAGQRSTSVAASELKRRQYTGIPLSKRVACIQFTHTKSGQIREGCFLSSCLTINRGRMLYSKEVDGKSMSTCTSLFVRIKQALVAWVPESSVNVSAFLSNFPSVQWLRDRRAVSSFPLCYLHRERWGVKEETHAFQNTSLPADVSEVDSDLWIFSKIRE